MTESCNLVSNVAVATSAGVGGKAYLGTGGLGNYSLVVVTLSCENFGVGVTTVTGIGSKTFLGAGGLVNYLVVAVTLSCGLFGVGVATVTGVNEVAGLGTGSVVAFNGVVVTVCGTLVAYVRVVTYGTGEGGKSTLGTGRLGNYGSVAVTVSGNGLTLRLKTASLTGLACRIAGFGTGGSQSFIGRHIVTERVAEGRTTLTGSGLETGCLGEGVRMIAGKLINEIKEPRHICELVTRGEAHEKYCQGKHEKR